MLALFQSSVRKILAVNQVQENGFARARRRWRRAAGKVRLGVRLGYYQDQDMEGLTRALRRLVWHIKRSGQTLPELFAQLDRDGGGTIDKTEFRMGMAAMGVRFDDGAIRALLRYIDDDDDGTLAIDEFCSKIEGLISQEEAKGETILSRLCIHIAQTGQSAEQLFEKLDTDGGGSLDAEEFHRALLELGLQTTPQGATNALSELDSDGDGSLDANELLMRISEFQRKRRVFANTVLLSIFEYVDRTNTSIMRVFACADRDGDGELDTVELQQALYKVGQNLSETEVDEIMYEIGGVARTETMTSMQFLDRLKQFEAERNVNILQTKELFVELDADGSGTLERDEIEVLAKKLGLGDQIQRDPGILDSMFRDIDGIDGDGQISLEELMPWFLTHGRSYLPQPEYQVIPDPKKPSTAELKLLFEQIDKDGSGRVDVGEVQIACLAIWPYLSPRSSRIAFGLADDDHSGEVDFGEFATLFNCLHYLNSRRHDIDSVEQEFVGHVDSDGFHLALHVMKIDMPLKERERRFAMLCAQAEETLPHRESKTVHAGGLESKSDFTDDIENEERLAEVFGQFGKVQAVTLRKRREVDKGVNKVSWALVTFESSSQANAAVLAGPSLHESNQVMKLRKLDLTRQLRAQEV